MEIKTAFGKRTAGVSVVVNSVKAPHARPLEGLTTERKGGNTFRHPVFGTGDRRGAHSQDTWVAQQIRPFFFRAVESELPKHLDRIERAILEALPGR